MPDKPPTGDDKACTMALHSVKVPSWDGVAWKEWPIELYRAGSICSSIRSMMPARLMSAVVLNLTLLRFAQDNADMLASCDTLLDGAGDDAMTL